MYSIEAITLLSGIELKLSAEFDGLRPFVLSHLCDVFSLRPKMAII